MDVISQLVLTSFVWVPALLVLYWVIRLAVRHAMEDARKEAQLDARFAAAREADRQQEGAPGPRHAE